MLFYVVLYLVSASLLPATNFGNALDICRKGSSLCIYYLSLSSEISNMFCSKNIAKIIYKMKEIMKKILDFFRGREKNILLTHLLASIVKVATISLQNTFMHF